MGELYSPDRNKVPDVDDSGWKIETPSGESSQTVFGGEIEDWPPTGSEKEPRKCRGRLLFEVGYISITALAGYWGYKCNDLQTFHVMCYGLVALLAYHFPLSKRLIEAMREKIKQ